VTRLKEHYKNKSTLKKYLAELEDNKIVNGDLPPVDLTYYHQVIEKVCEEDELYILRIVDFTYGYYLNGGVEKYRVLFNKNGYWQTYIYGRIGQSDVWAYRECGQRMGYHQADHLEYIKAPLTNKSDLFKYINFEGLEINGFYLVRHFLQESGRKYALELLIKSGRKKLAEVYVNDGFGCDIKHVLKYNSKLLNNPSANKLRLASQLGEIVYQRGMLSYLDKYYSRVGELLKKLLEYTTFKKFHKYCKEQLEKGYSQFRAKSNYDFLRDYLDYRELNTEFGLPDYPKDLYEAKELLREQQEQIKLKKYLKKVKQRAKELKVLENNNFIVMPPRSVEDFVNEGKVLHHCIAQYISRYANKECDIYFVRKIENPEKPFVTVEINGGEILQMRGLHNQTNMITPEVKQLVSSLI
jgi:hypothetical protein